MNMCNRVIATTVAATIVLTTLTGCSSNSEKALKANTQPTVDQTAFVELTNAPTEQPTATPTVSPTIEPTETPTEEPTVIPTATLQAELPLAPLADDGMTTVQRNSMGMLNYLSVLTQEINASQNSRMYLEQAYSLLINNTYPNSVDSRTLFQISGLLDILEKYRMIAVKRERLEYVYDQNRAQALRSAIPNPLGLLSAVQSFSLSRLAVSVVYMAVDSLSSYASNTAQADMQYLQNGWALDDEAAEALHQSRKSMFSYLVRSVDDYDLPGDLRSGDIVTISISLDTTRKYDDLSFVFEAKSEKNWLQIEQIRFYRES